MIVSASYKTDIPAFYPDWFKNRLVAGFCKMVNPYNQQVYDISLKKEDVQGFVFWSRNYQPFITMGMLDELIQPFVCHLTITNYPRRLDKATIASKKAIEQLHVLSKQYGKRVCIWRYDPIVLSPELTPEWHVENFRQIAQGVAGAVDEVIVSYLQPYRKTLRNFAEDGFTFCDPEHGAKQELLLRLFEVAEMYGMRLTLCAQPDLLVGNIEPSACIDARRLEDLGGKPLYVSTKPHRKECGCVASKDIGDYNTCPHGCLYCYAVEKRSLAKERYQNHDPDSPFLFEHANMIVPSSDQGLLF